MLGSPFYDSFCFFDHVMEWVLLVWVLLYKMAWALTFESGSWNLKSSSSIILVNFVWNYILLQSESLDFLFLLFCKFLGQEHFIVIIYRCIDFLIKSPFQYYILKFCFFRPLARNSPNQTSTCDRNGRTCKTHCVFFGRAGDELLLRLLTFSKIAKFDHNFQLEFWIWLSLFNAG